MYHNAIEMMSDPDFQTAIRQAMPTYFLEAEYNNMQNYSVNMAVGKMRETILIQVLICLLEDQPKDIDISNIAALEKDIDLWMFQRQVSMKTATVSSKRAWGCLKVNWVSGVKNAIDFAQAYKPCADLLLTRIVWDGTGQMSYIPLSVQLDVLNEMGYEGYLESTKTKETDGKGLRMKAEAGHRLLEDERTVSFDIEFPFREKISDGIQRFWRDRITKDMAKRKRLADRKAHDARQLCLF